MRTIFLTDGTSLDLDRQHTFDELKKLCGFEYAELVVRVGKDGDHTMLIDEEGRCKPDPILNSTASTVASAARGYPFAVYGNVAVVPKGDIT